VKLARLLILSLGLNALLALVWLYLWQQPAAPVRPPAAPPPRAETTTPRQSAAPAPSPVPAVTPFRWSQIESPDYHQYIANLRAVGCPERLIQDIIVADVTSLYHGKSVKLNRAVMAHPVEPWVGADQRKRMQQNAKEQEVELGAEERALIKELLGIDWNKQITDIWGSTDTALMLGYLPEEKVQPLLALAVRLDEGMNRIQTESGGIMIAEDYVRMNRLRDGLLAQATQLLTPAEADELEHRFQYLMFSELEHNHLEGVAFSSAEFRELVGASRTIRDVLRMDITELESGEVKPEIAAQRKAAFEQQVAALLGPARFADYQRAQDAVFRETYDFTQEKHLTLAAAAAVANARHNAEEQAAQIKADATLSAEEQQVALQVLVATTRNTISGALGPAAGEYLKVVGPTLDNLGKLPPPQPKEQP